MVQLCGCSHLPGLWFGYLLSGSFAGVRYVRAAGAFSAGWWGALPRLMTTNVILHHATPETARETGLGASLKLVETAPGTPKSGTGLAVYGRRWG